nr:putative ion channel [Oceanusvirus sp.]
MKDFVSGNNKMKISLFPPRTTTEKIVVHLSLLAFFCAVNSVLVLTKVAKYNVESMSVFDAVHFTITTWTTTGYGDIYPTNAVARVMSWIKMLLFLVVVVA